MIITSGLPISRPTHILTPNDQTHNGDYVTGLDDVIKAAVRTLSRLYNY